MGTNWNRAVGKGEAIFHISGEGYFPYIIFHFSFFICPCAILLSSVALWWSNSSKTITAEPQRLRGSTENKMENEKWKMIYGK